MLYSACHHLGQISVFPAYVLTTYFSTAIHILFSHVHALQNKCMYNIYMLIYSMYYQLWLYSVSLVMVDCLLYSVSFVRCLMFIVNINQLSHKHENLQHSSLLPTTSPPSLTYSHLTREFLRIYAVFLVSMTTSTTTGINISVQNMGVSVQVGRVSSSGACQFKWVCTPSTGGYISKNSCTFLKFYWM